MAYQNYEIEKLFGSEEITQGTETSPDTTSKEMDTVQTVLKSKGSQKLKQKHKYRSTGVQCKPMTPDFSAMCDSIHVCENTIYTNESILHETFGIEN